MPVTSRMPVSSTSFTRVVPHAVVANRFKLPLIVWIASSLLATVVAAQPLVIVESSDLITVKRGDRVVVTYNKMPPPAPPGIDRIYRRSGCLHPVTSPQGLTVTQMFPFDHPHQHGIFSAWVKTTYAGQPVDFWNLAGGTGRVIHERVVSKSHQDGAAIFEVDMIHRAETEPPIEVLRERWKITVQPTDATYHCFDLETTQTAITDKPLTVSKHHYGGIVLRGPTRWLTEEDRDARKRTDLVREPSEFVNDLGSDRVNGNLQHAKWVALSGSIDGKPVSIAVLSHKENFRAPQATRLHPTKPYFCFAPCIDGTFTIDREHPFKARYRYLVTDAKPDIQWINRQWEKWSGE